MRVWIRMLAGRLKEVAIKQLYGGRSHWDWGIIWSREREESWMTPRSLTCTMRWV